jgi:RHS repeat-associated protein
MYRGGNTLGARDLGNKHYELGNRLGNVLAVVTDNIHMADDLTTTAVASASDYYPFGLQMDSRTVNEGDYRYGFNGKEKDQDGEWGSSTNYDYGFRIYSPAIARFLSVDPLSKSYPMLTPYQFASNRPIDGIDLDGLEYVRADQAVDSYGTTVEQALTNSNQLNFTFGTMSSDAYGILMSNVRVPMVSPERVTINGQDYYDVGQHLYLGSNGLSTTGTRSQQITDETRVGIQLVSNYNNLSTSTPSNPIAWSDETVAGITQTHADANTYQDCYGVCYAVTGARANRAYEDMSGSGVINLTVSSGNQDHLISATAITTGQYAGYGVGGALLRNGYGTIVNDVWSGDLQQGALLQIWHPPVNSNPYSGGGHSQVFESYTYDNNGNITGMNIIDNYSGGTQETIPRSTSDTIRAVNLTDEN